MTSITNLFAAVQLESSQRFSELRSFWSSVKSQSAPPPSPQPFVYLAGTGFTVIYIYSVLEFTINRAVKQLSQLITNYNVRSCDVSHAVMSLVYEPKITAIKNAGRKTKISSRMNLFNSLSEKSNAVLFDSLLSNELQNVWTKSISDTFMVFGIEGDFFLSPASASHIDKLVDDRNAIAHGRERPEIIGASYTTKDIDDLIARIELETQFIISKFRFFYEGRQFIDSRHRTRYLNREAAASAAVV